MEARLVAKGFPKENQGNIRKDSPTCLNTSLRLALSSRVSDKWITKVLDIKGAFFQGQLIDIKSAFFQGQLIERDVFLKPPKEAGTSKFWKLKKRYMS